jgi:hypothetical protein
MVHFVVPVFVLKRSLRAVLLRDPVLFWALGVLLYVFIFRTSQVSHKYDRETPWPVLAPRPTMIREEGRIASRSCQAIMVSATG